MSKHPHQVSTRGISLKAFNLLKVSRLILEGPVVVAEGLGREIVSASSVQTVEKLALMHILAAAKFDSST